MRWTIERHTGRAADHLALPPAEGPEVRILDVIRPAVIMGSGQAESTLDAGRAAAAGVDIVRRPSGGGAVLVVPGEALWIDVFVPAGDRLWVDDVGVAFHWLGEAFTEALATIGVEARWHDGPMRNTPWSKVVCFAGLGPGEVIDPAGRKLVGFSQRRTRSHARFQCCALLRWDPAAMVALLAEPYPEKASAADLAAVATGIGPERGAPFVTALTEVFATL
ncbi:MAG: lipoyl protein ligase domain-containing protein [Acidimicrobiia bacterium]